MKLVYYIIKIDRNSFTEDIHYYMKVLINLNVIFATYENGVCWAVCEDSSLLHLYKDLLESFPSLDMYVYIEGSPFNFNQLVEMCGAIREGNLLVDRCSEFGVDFFF